MLNYKLRPHHGLCTYFFKGKGYSNDFVENMTFVTEQLMKNPMIELIKGNDIICSCCPNNNETKKTCFEKASRYDKAVLEVCNLSFGDNLPFEDFQEKIKQNILKNGKLSTICGDCQWFSICNTYTL